MSSDERDSDFHSKDEDISRPSTSKIRDTCPLCLTSNSNPVVVSSPDSKVKGKHFSPYSHSTSNPKKIKSEEPIDLSQSTKTHEANDDTLNTSQKLVEAELVHQPSTSRFLPDPNVPGSSIPHISVKEPRHNLSKSLKPYGLIDLIKTPRNLSKSEGFRFQLGPEIEEKLRSDEIKLPFVSECHASPSSTSMIKTESDQASSMRENEKWESESEPVRGKYGSAPVCRRRGSASVRGKRGSASMRGMRARRSVRGMCGSVPVHEKNILQVSGKHKIMENSENTVCAPVRGRRCSAAGSRSVYSSENGRKESNPLNRQFYGTLDFRETPSTSARRHPSRTTLEARSYGSTLSEQHSEASMSKHTRSASTNRVNTTMPMDQRHFRFLNRHHDRLIEELYLFIQLLNRSAEIEQSQRRSNGAQTQMRSVGVQTETTSVNASNQTRPICIQVQSRFTTRPVLNVSIDRLLHMQPRNRLRCLSSINEREESPVQEVPHSSSVSANNSPEFCLICGQSHLTGSLHSHISPSERTPCQSINRPSSSALTGGLHHDPMLSTQDYYPLESAWNGNSLANDHKPSIAVNEELHNTNRGQDEHGETSYSLQAREPFSEIRKSTDEELPFEELPFEGLPFEELPVEGSSVEGSPVEGLPVEVLPVEGLPVEVLSDVESTNEGSTTERSITEGSTDDS